VEPNPTLFKNLIFYLEIKSGDGGDAQPNTFFEKVVIECGGKLSRRLGKHVTHLVWSQGKEATLKRALEYDDLKIVSTLWF